VASTGPVISPDKVDQLFQPFQRLNARRAHHGNGHRNGYGLGLSIVRAIAAATASGPRGVPWGSTRRAAMAWPGSWW
jgi:K+-sensing histidine kinase KdpD